jgi:hypothetical protein
MGGQAMEESRIIIRLNIPALSRTAQTRPPYGRNAAHLIDLLAETQAQLPAAEEAKAHRIS